MIRNTAECALAKGQRRHKLNRNYAESASLMECYSESLLLSVMFQKAHPNNCGSRYLCGRCPCPSGNGGSPAAVVQCWYWLCHANHPSAGQPTSHLCSGYCVAGKDPQPMRVNATIFEHKSDLTNGIKGAPPGKRLSWSSLEQQVCCWDCLWVRTMPKVLGIDAESSHLIG